MAAFTVEQIYGLTAFRTVTPSGADLGIALDPNAPAGKLAYPRGLLLGTAGNVTVVGVDDTTPVTLTGLAAGVWHNICVKQITATTGANLVVGY